MEQNLETSCFPVPAEYTNIYCKLLLKVKVKIFRRAEISFANEANIYDTQSLISIINV